MLHEGVYTMTCGDQIDHDEHHSVVMAAAFWKQEHDKLKSTLDEIKLLYFKTSLSSDYRDYWEAWDKLGSILSKHEDDV